MQNKKLLSSFSLEPLSKIEAWQYLNKKNAINISIRNLAQELHWHKSKVERFLKHLKKNSMIELSIESGITVINVVSRDSNRDIYITAETPVKSMAAENIKNTSETVTETLKETVLSLQTESQDTDDPFKSLVNSVLEYSAHAKSIQQNDFSEQKEKQKEKNQKKEKEKNIKEKIPPMGVKKEKIWFENVEIWQVQKLASSLDLSESSLAWELEKFKDYWLAAPKKPPKDGVAAFRNWLRISVELKKERKNYDKSSRTKLEQTSGFERFIAGGIRAIDEIKHNRLDGKIDRQSEQLHKPCSSSKKGFQNIRAVN